MSDQVPDDPLRLTLALRPRSAALARRVAAVSTPGGDRYANYQAVGALAHRFGAPGQDRQAVIRWLTHHGATFSPDPTHSFVVSTMTPAVARRLVGVPLALYEKGGESFVGVTRPGHAPDRLRGRVTGVLGLAPPPPPSVTETGPVIKPPPVRTGTPSGCAGGVASGGMTPSQIATAYGATTLHGQRVAGHGIRVALLEGERFKQSDLEAWGSCFGIDVPQVRVRVVPGTTDLGGGGEAALDAEVLLTIAPRVRQVQMYQADTSLADFPGLFAAPLDRRLNGGNLPDVIVRSYGGCERAWAHQAPAGVRVMNHVLMTAAAAGVTVITSAGDRGSSDCQRPDGTIAPKLNVRYPASSPYVAAAGGTSLRLNAANEIVSQPAWNDEPYGNLRAGGGGFSQLFARPSWQRAPGVTGRARSSPDVSFFADTSIGYSVYCTTMCPINGWHTAAGTSAAAPLLGGAVALADQLASRARRPSLGLLDPLLYRLARRQRPGRIFDDVRAGGTDLFALGCCRAGPGYDRATGIGSVRLDAFARAAAGSGRVRTP